MLSSNRFSFCYLFMGKGRSTTRSDSIWMKKFECELYFSPSPIPVISHLLGPNQGSEIGQLKLAFCPSLSAVQLLFALSGTCKNDLKSRQCASIRTKCPNHPMRCGSNTLIRRRGSRLNTLLTPFPREYHWTCPFPRGLCWAVDTKIHHNIAFKVVRWRKASVTDLRTAMQIDSS